MRFLLVAVSVALMKLKFITDEVLSRTLAAAAGGQNGDAGFGRRDFPKRRGFFFQGEANEGGHLKISTRLLLVLSST